MAVLLKGTTFSSGQSVDHTDINNIIDTATLNPSESTGIIGGQTAEAAIASGDFVLVQDVSGTDILRKATVANIVGAAGQVTATSLDSSEGSGGVIGGQTEETAVASDDFVLIQDMSGTDILRKATVANLIGDLGVIQTDVGTAVGKSALAALTSGTDNVAVGYSALYTLASGTFNTAVGSNALKVATGHANTAVGGDSMKATTSGDFNVAVGVDTLLKNVTGTMNTAVGFVALENNTGSYNSAVGTYAAKGNTSGEQNTAVGVEALYTNSNQNASTAVGFQALRAKTGLGGCTAVGSAALKAMTSGVDNCAVGRNAGLGMIDGNYNAIFGQIAGTGITSGDSNVCIGTQSGQVITTGDNNITIGHEAEVSAAGAANQIVIGDGIAATANDEFSFGKTSNVASCDFGTSASWAYASDERKKQDIQPDPLGLDFVNELRPVTYRWKPIAQWPTEWAESKGDEVDTETVMHGMLAQEVKAALDNAGVETFSGWKERPDGQQALALESFIMPLIKAVQELSAKVEKLESK